MMKKYLYLELSITGYYGDHLYLEGFESKDGPVPDFWDESSYFPFYDLESAIESIHKLIDLKREKDLDFKLSRAQLQDFLKCLEDKNLGQEMFNNFLTNLRFLDENNILRECLTNDPKYCAGNYLGLFENGEPTQFLANPLDFKKRAKRYLLSKKYNGTRLLEIFLETTPEDISKEKTELLRKEYLEQIKAKELEILEAQKLLEELKSKLIQLEVSDNE